MTLSGSSPEDRWYLLTTTFDFRITGTGAERERRRAVIQSSLSADHSYRQNTDTTRFTARTFAVFPRRPKKRARAILISHADAELAPRSVALAPEDHGAAAGAEAEEPEGDALTVRAHGDRYERRDAPLVRAYNFLRRYL